MLGFDRYAYVNNSPVNNIDPDGHECKGVSMANGVDVCAGQSSSGSNYGTGTGWSSANPKGWLEQQYQATKTYIQDKVINLEYRINYALRNVNPTGSTTNSFNCSIATDATIAGNRTSALPGKPVPLKEVVNSLSNNFDPVKVQQSFSSPVLRAEIVSQLETAGSASRGLVFGNMQYPGTGHVFNAINVNGEVRFIDGQVGRLVSEQALNSFVNFFFFRTK